MHWKHLARAAAKSISILVVSSCLMGLVLAWQPAQFARAAGNTAPVANDDAVSTDDNTPVVINVLLNDHDPDGDILSIKSVTQPPAGDGLVTFTANSLTYTPAPDLEGIVQFTYTISDGRGGQATATVTVTVTDTNTPPAAENDTIQTTQGREVIIPVLANDSDYENDPLILPEQPLAPEHGSAVVNLAAQTITYTPPAGFLGVDRFSYLIREDNDLQAEDTAEVLVTVNPDVDLAVTKTVNLDQALPGDPLTYTLTIQNSGNSSFPAAGTPWHFANAGRIDIPAQGWTNASVINVSGLTGNLAGLSVTLHGLSHTFPADADIFLQAPNGEKVILLSDAGGGTDLANATLTFDDSLAPGGGSLYPNVPAAGPVSSGTYHTTNYGEGDDFPSGMLTSLTQLNPANTNGEWRLYIIDDTAGDGGKLLSGWSLSVQTDGAPVITLRDSLPSTLVDPQLPSPAAVNWSDCQFLGAAPNQELVCHRDANAPFAPGATEEIVFTGKVSIAGEILNRAVVSMSPPMDRKSGNDASEAGTTVLDIADVELFSITASSPNPAPDEIIRFTLTYRNNSLTSTATGVTVTHTLPAGLTLLNPADPTDPNAPQPAPTRIINEQELVWEVGSLAPNPGLITFTISFSAKVGTLKAGTLLTNTASITSPNDNMPGNNTRTLSLTVQNVAPVAQDGQVVTLNEDTQKSITLQVTDANGDLLTISIVSPPAHGTLTQQGSRWLYDPFDDYYGPDSFTYNAMDDQVPPLSDTGSVQITVNPVNDAPRIDPIVYSPDPVYEGDIVTATITAFDPEGEPITFSLLEPSYGAAITANGNFSWNTNESHGQGTYTIKVRATTNPANPSQGGTTSTQSFSIQVNAVNNEDPNVVADTYTVFEDSGPQTLSVLDNDLREENDGEVFTILPFSKIALLYGAIERAADGQALIYTPANLQTSGTDTFSYQVSDGARTSQATVTIQYQAVNDPPIAIGDVALTDEEIPVVIDVLANDYDEEGAALFLPPDQSILALNGTVVISGPTGLIYTPAEDFFGTDTFTYTVSDGSSTATAPVTVTVQNVNDPPIAAADTIDSIEDTDAVISVADLLQNDTDVDGDPLSITAVSGASPGAVSLSGTTITYTPPKNFAGAASFQYTLSDGQGGTATGTVTIQVAGVNDAPVLTALGGLAVGELPLTFTIDEGQEFGFIAEASDVDSGQTLTFSLDAGAATGAAITPDGRFTWTPAETQGPGLYYLTVRVMDNGDPPGSDATVIFIEVREVNDAPPNALDDQFYLVEDSGPNRLDVLLNDTTEPDDGETLTIIAAGPAGYGQVTFTGSDITYTPADHFDQTDTFTYTVSDGKWTDSAQVRVILAGDQDPPVATADEVSTLEDTSVSIAILANDYDPDGDPFTIASLGEASHGSLELSGEEVIYTPAADYHGDDSFTYEITDGNLRNTGTVTIRVIPVNDAPVARDDHAVTVEDLPVRVDVLRNDTDVDGTALVIQAVGDPANGAAVIDGAAILYTPDHFFFGTDVFTYTVSDGELSATASVSVTVNEAFFFAYLPIVSKPGKPDLVGSFTLTPDRTTFTAGEPVTITVTVTNQGAAPARDFWVDFYINPMRTPEANKTWSDLCDFRPCFGIAWFVPGTLAPGESITLTSTPDSFSPEHSRWLGWFARGTTHLYLYVDAWNPLSPDSALEEYDETNNLFEMHGLEVTGANPDPYLVADFPEGQSPPDELPAGELSQPGPPDE